MGTNEISLILKGIDRFKSIAPSIADLCESTKNNIAVFFFVKPKQQMCLESCANLRFRTVIINGS